jgi:hypothetical protein
VEGWPHSRHRASDELGHSEVLPGRVLGRWHTLGEAVLSRCCTRRDALLHKLFSGELRLRDAERFILRVGL